MFLATMGGLSLGAGMGAAAASPRRLFLLENLYLKAGSQPGRIHEAIQSALPVLNKHHQGAKIFLEALVAPHMPQFAAIYEFASWQSLWTFREKIMADAEYRKLSEALENHPEPPFEQQTTTLLEATDYCPEIKPDATPRKRPRIFELRVYHSPTFRQLRALHERFAGPEIKIFHRSGVHPILYSSTLIGPNRPNLTYLTPFDSLAAREKAWTAFGADPEWIKVRQESIQKHGQISSIIQIALYRATPYSPVG